MARETKVGLLAGLAFIICFAVILTNRGGNQPPLPSPSVLSDSGLNLPATLQSQTQPLSRTTGRKQLPAGSAAHPSPRTILNQTAEEPAAPSGANLTTLGRPSTPPSPTAPIVTGTTGPESGNHRVEPVVATNENLESILASRMRQGAGGLNVRDGSMTATPERADAIRTPDVGAPVPTTIQPAAPLGDARPANVTTYTVKASDTLSSIAAMHYGTRSRSAINALFDANRHVLADPNHIKAGSQLTIPTYADAVTKLPSAAPNSVLPSPTRKVSDVPAKAEIGSKAKQAPPEFRWYQVKKNDRYASIAREQLGDAKRWRELYELNIDKFPDPQKIREGVRIKLPVHGSVLAAGREKRP